MRRVASFSGHPPGGAQVAKREQQRRYEPGQDQPQHAHRGQTGGGQCEQDQVVRGGHQRAHQRGVGGDVDCVVGVIPLLLHQRDHHRAHGRDVRHGRADHTTEQGAAEHVAHPQPTAHMAHQAVGQAHDALGNPAVEHQFAREDEERDGEEAEDLHPAHHLLEHDGHRQASHQDGGHRRQPDGKSHRHAQQEQHREAHGQHGQFHAVSTVVPRHTAIRCSTENSTISTPAIITGT